MRLPDEPDRLAFIERHRPALERDEARHNILLTIIDRMAAGAQSNARHWTLGEGGACAVQTPPYPFVLGDLSEPQCRAFAEATRDLDYPGVVGPDRTATWFAERAMDFGIAFQDTIPEQIHTLCSLPRYPGAAGHASKLGADDAALFHEWLTAFVREAVPHDRQPTREQTAAMAADGLSMLWIVDGAPVSMARIARQLKRTAAISQVYTPPELRQRGYAGSIVAAVVERIFAEGRDTACLYTDMRNPFSNRCYAKIGFRPVCESRHIPRVVLPQTA
jgi:ribosomal protein S18 acetylase RimI-like enzyme